MYFLVLPLFIVPSIKAGVEERRILKCTSRDNRHTYIDSRGTQVPGDEVLYSGL
jgi:hypothetical protein